MQLIIKVPQEHLLNGDAIPNGSKPFRGCLFIEQLSEGAPLLFQNPDKKYPPGLIWQLNLYNCFKASALERLTGHDPPPLPLPMCHCCEWLDFDVHWVKHMILRHVGAVTLNHVWTTKQGRLFGNCGPSTRSLSFLIWHVILLSETDVMVLDVQQRAWMVKVLPACAARQLEEGAAVPSVANSLLYELFRVTLP